MMRSPGMTVRAEYDRPEFREMWHDPKVTISRIAQKYGVSAVSVWDAARRRGFEKRAELKARTKNA